ncbi:MAG: ABC transporter substrate-binding protein [Neisseria sp.]|nr:ABC transporter substrate-binding protein [Neisseria sp.]
MKNINFDIKDLAPEGYLRAAINLGNPILAAYDEAGGQPCGVSVDLARRLAEQVNMELRLVVYDAAGKSVAGVAAGEADFGFFAVDPQRGRDIAFTEPYVLIEGCYLVADASPITRNEQVDRDTHTVVVGKGSAYDLFLSRELKHAEIVRSPTSPTVVDTFIERQADVAAGVKQQLEADAKRIGGLRLLDGHFMVIRQAMGTAKNRGAQVAEFLADFVEAAKADGFVTEALVRHGIQGAAVAPPAGK